MSKFLTSWACSSRAHCRACRTLPDWRGETGAPEDCPHGVTVEDLPEPVEAEPKDTLLGARRREICHKCGWSCGMKQRPGCKHYVRNYLATPGSMCPEGHWHAERH